MAVTYVNQIGAVDGMNQTAPGTLIPEGSVRWAQDVLFDRAGLMRRRGPFEEIITYDADNQPFNAFNSNPNLQEERVLSTVFTYNPQNEPRIGVFVNVKINNITYPVLRVFDGNFQYLGSERLLANAGTATSIGSLEEFSIVFTHPGSQGGVWITFANSITNAADQYQFFWHGGHGNLVNPANPANDDDATDPLFYAQYFAGTINTQNLTNRAASSGLQYQNSIINVNPLIAGALFSSGQFVYYNDTATGKQYYVGIIKSVNGNTITLEKAPYLFLDGLSNNTALVSTTGNFWATSVRPYEHLHGRGLVTTTNNNPIIKSGAIGGLAEGHWKSAGIDSTKWDLYRYNDNAYLGTISSVTDNATATLANNPNVDIAADEYVMKDRNGYANAAFWDRFKLNNANLNISNFAGTYTSTYQGLEWWAGFPTGDEANTNRVVFSAPHNGEAVDLSIDAADSIIFPGNNQMRGIASTVSGLVVFLDNKTYIIRGSNRTNFAVEQLYPEGCLSPSSIYEYNGGVFWAGTSGLLFFDGSSVRNLTQDSLGQFYTSGASNFNPEDDTIYTWIYKNYVFVTFSDFDSSYTPYRYEAVYETEWDDNVQNPQLNRTWNDLIAGDAVGVSGFGFDYNDFEGPNPAPFYWDRKPLIGADIGAIQDVIANWNATTGPTGSTSGVWSDATHDYNYIWTTLYSDTKTAITFAIYLPTLAVTTIKNFQVQASTTFESAFGSTGVSAINALISGVSGSRMRLVNPNTMIDYDTNGQDAFTCSLNNVSAEIIEAGPDFYLQTKCFTVGDPILRKWFQRLLMDMVLQDGAVRVDFVDSDDNDDIDISVKKPKTWQVFTPNGYNWRYLTTRVFKGLTSPYTPNWSNIQSANLTWVELARSDYERYTKRFSWRKSGLGLRIYQLNNYRTNSAITTPDKPERVDIQGFTIGFKPLRSGRQ